MQGAGSGSNRLKRLRSASRLSLEEAADKLGIDASTLARYELGEQPIPEMQLRQLAHFYGVSVDHLLALDEPQRESGEDGEEEEGACS